MLNESFVFKMNEVVDCCKLKRMVSAIHYRKQDIWEGDVVDRIEEFSYYRLQEIPISSIIDYNHYTTDDEMVSEYATLNYHTMPPIIIHPGKEAMTYHLVDGGHRAQACLKQGIIMIKAFVGWSESSV